MRITPERVLGVLSRGGRRPLTTRRLLLELGAPRHERARLKRVLGELVERGVLERVGSRYRAPRADGLVEGVFDEAAPRARAPGREAPGATGRRPTHGSVRDDDGRVFAVGDAGDARPGDRVLLLARPGAGAQGEVVQVLSGARGRRIGIVERAGRGAVVTPYRDDSDWLVRIAPADLGGARAGDVVEVAVVGGRGRPAPGLAGSPPGSRRERAESRGRVVAVLGRPGDPEADFRTIVYKHRLPTGFPAAALREADALEAGLDPDELGRRVDLRDRALLTIDPATARDHDDAVCVEPASDGALRLWVAIADVAHYVREGSALDREALRRGNSVYFPDRAIPMLPERLSGGLCSLRPGVDRYAFAVELLVDAAGDVRRRSFYPAVMRSRARLSYDQAATVMEGGSGGDLDAGVVEQLGLLADVAGRLMRRRFAEGSIDFDLPSAEIVLDEQGRPIDVVATPRTIAHRAIEEAMLAANRAVAEALDRAGVPALFRVHEPPTPADAEALRELLETFGLLSAANGGGRSRRASRGRAREGGSADGPPPAEIARALRRAAGRPEERLVNTAVLRCMRQARYEDACRGHFALAFAHYTHFTSPIRRHADLVVHRALRDLVEGGSATAAGRGSRADGRERAGRSGRLASLATRLSLRERIAEAAEREIIDLKKCLFMREHLGEAFDGVISGVARHGLYVTLDAFFVEGLVHVAALPEYVELDEHAFALVARRSGARYRLSDRVRVRLEAVDLRKGWIDLSLEDGSTGRARGRGSRSRARGRAGRGRLRPGRSLS